MRGRIWKEDALGCLGTGGDTIMMSIDVLLMGKEVDLEGVNDKKMLCPALINLMVLLFI